MPSIKDVPCLSCQKGYNKTHTCDIPDYCPCDRENNHDNKVGVTGCAGRIK